MATDTRTATRSTLSSRVPDVFVSNPKVVFGESIVALLAVWWALGAVFGIADVISSPVRVGASTAALLASMEWLPHVVATLKRTLYGFIITMVIGTTLGVMMGVSDFWKDALKDYITVGLALPSLFAVIFVAMWFAPTSLVTELTPAVAAMTISFPFVTQNVYQGVRDIDNDLIEMSSAFEVSRGRMVRRVVVQSVMPEWFSGARYAFAICWKITTLAELIVAEVGIGYQIQEQMSLLSLTGVLTWTILFLFLIMIAEYGIFQQIEKRVFAWRQSEGVAWA